MCRFFSGIIAYKHKKVWYDIDLDSHTDIMNKFEIKDEKLSPNFVKFELTPIDKNIFNHAKKNWVFSIDEDSQDIIPDWFDLARAKAQAWECLQDVFKKRFLINSKIQEIREGRWFIKDSDIQNVRGGTIQDVSGGTIRDVWGGTIKNFNGGIIKNFNDGIIRDVNGGNIDNVRGGIIQDVWGGTIDNVRGGIIKYVSGGTIDNVRGGIIKNVSGGIIRDVWGGNIDNVRGGIIQNVWGGKRIGASCAAKNRA